MLYICTNITSRTELKIYDPNMDNRQIITILQLGNISFLIIKNPVRSVISMFIQYSMYI